MELATQVFTGLSLVIIGLFTLSLLVVPVIGSLTICAPKWWSKKAKPKLAPVRKQLGRAAESGQLSAPVLTGVFYWILSALATIGAVLAWPLKQVLRVLDHFYSWYTERVTIFIEERCPYTVSPSELRESACGRFRFGYFNAPSVCTDCGIEQKYHGAS